jgi:acetylglutamate kinase
MKLRPVVPDYTTKEEVLIEALPYIQKYERTVFVIKYGGAAMTDPALKETFAKDVTLLRKIGIDVVIVHGGGKETTTIAQKLGIPSRFVDGQRYTDEPMLQVVLMVLAGSVNKEIVRLINRWGGNAVGLCGVDHSLLQARRQTSAGEDLGLVGEITAVNTTFLRLLLENTLMPVLAPIGLGADGIVYNINADLAAAAVAQALNAEKLVYLSDVEGVVVEDRLVSTLGKSEAAELIRAGKISGGMIPKIQSAFESVQSGVRKVHIVDGRVKHSLLLEIFTDEGIGTQLIPDVLNEE